MAKIVASDLHPSTEVTHALGPAKAFKLSPGGSFETNDLELIANARVNPWLDVETDPALMIEGQYRDTGVPYNKDVLAAPNSIAFDPDAVRKAMEAQEQEDANPVAINAGLDQDKPKSIGDTAVTLAADETNEKTGRSSGDKKE